MAASFLETIDWHRPWLELLRQTAQPVLGATDWRTGLNDAARAIDLCNHRGLPVSFVPQSDLPAGVAYEAFISDTGGVPTRDNLHDFFNALVWLTFPAIKKQLNALQAAELARKRNMAPALTMQAAGTRGNVRDAATIFDENAALLICSDPQWAEHLRQHRWQQALLAERRAFASTVRVFLFGHALVEKLVNPYKAITAHTVIVPADAAFFVMPATEQCRWLDATMAQQLTNGINTSVFTPLPVLGIPGWWTGQDTAFYADASVFRPRRQGAGPGVA